MSDTERREVIREAIHRVACGRGDIGHNASLGLCSVAADAVAMDLAGVSVPANPEAPHPVPWPGVAAYRGAQARALGDATDPPRRHTAFVNAVNALASPAPEPLENKTPPDGLQFDGHIIVHVAACPICYPEI